MNPASMSILKALRKHTVIAKRDMPVYIGYSEITIRNSLKVLLDLKYVEFYVRGQSKYYSLTLPGIRAAKLIS